MQMAAGCGWSADTGRMGFYLTPRAPASIMRSFLFFQIGSFLFLSVNRPRYFIMRVVFRKDVTGRILKA